MNFLFICLLLSGLSQTDLFSQIPTSGLIGFYPFNGNVDDESGNGYNGSLMDAIQISDRFGVSDKAYSFNGVNSSISLPDSFDVLPRTVSLWFNVADTNFLDSYGAIFQSDHPGLLYGSMGMAVKEIDGVKKLLLTFSAVTDTVDIISNTWYNATITVDASKNIFYYLDGILLKSKSFTGFITSIDGDTNIVIGAGRTESSRYFKGIIDEIRIYNRVLSQNEIEAIYNDGACTNLISVSDTLVINTNLAGSNPVSYKNPIKVYPNPTKDQVVIDCGSDYSVMGNNTIMITNSQGRTLFSSKISQQEFQLSLASWSGPGLYLLYILDSQNNVIDVKKIVLE